MLSEIDGLSLHQHNPSHLDFNECLIDRGPCAYHCRNTVGSYKCECDTSNGFILGEDRRSCRCPDEKIEKDGKCGL